MQIILLCILQVLILGPCIVHAATLTADQMTRLKNVKELLIDVEPKTLAVMLKDLQKSPNPSMNLKIKEAMAKTYVEIVQEQHVQGIAKKQWLYSMVALNMAYLQFAAAKDSAGSSQNLNKLIRMKLKSHLPADIYQMPGFHCSIE